MKNITKTEKSRKKVAEILTLFPKLSRIHSKLLVIWKVLKKINFCLLCQIKAEKARFGGKTCEIDSTAWLEVEWGAAAADDIFGGGGGAG